MTPVEYYDDVYVKRDDLCFASPAPPFAKCRGIISHLNHLKTLGVTTVGYQETAISAAGWGVAWACRQLQMTAVIFDPQYKKPCETLLYHRAQWQKFGVVIECVPAGRAKVSWYLSKRLLCQKYGDNAVMLPLGLPFEATIEATCEEALVTFRSLDVNFATIVCCVGSGTIMAGVCRALHQLKWQGTAYGVMSRSGNAIIKRKNICKKAGIELNGFFATTFQLEIINPGWQYADYSTAECPFPCNKYYDLKSWQFLLENKNNLKQPVLFWNIGS